MSINEKGCRPIVTTFLTRLSIHGKYSEYISGEGDGWVGFVDFFVNTEVGGRVGGKWTRTVAKIPQIVLLNTTPPTTVRFGLELKL